jgi:hypothetical protein
MTWTLSLKAVVRDGFGRVRAVWRAHHHTAKQKFQEALDALVRLRNVP